EKKTRLHKAGAPHVIATQEQDMVAEVMRITNGNGARVAFDPVGGPDFPKLISALTDQGIAYIYGALSEGDTRIPALEMLFPRCDTCFVTGLGQFGTPEDGHLNRL